MVDVKILLPLLKTQLRIDSTEKDEIAYLTHLLKAAIKRFTTYTGLILSQNSTRKKNHIVITEDITQGLLLLVGQWYEYRENLIETGFSKMPEATETLWKPYIQYDLGKNRK